MVAMIGKLADQVWAKVAKGIDDGSTSPAAAIEAFANGLPRVMDRAFRDHAKWAWARSTEVWSVLTVAQRARLAKFASLREDDIAKANPGRFDFEGEKVKVFRAPDAEKIDAWVNNPGWFQGQDRTWRDRFEAMSHKIADKDELRNTITTMYADGATPDQIRKAIQPSVDGIKSSAERIARTETLRISEEAQRETYAQVGDLISGIQIWATLDDRTRPEHAARNGQVYPADACPLVPDEPNCRCFTSPVLRDDAELVRADVGGRPAGNLTVVNGTVQDLETWGNWFDAQTPARQMAVIGPERWETLNGKLEGKPRWAHVVDQNGYMNTPEQLKAIEPEALKSRAANAPPASAPTAIADESPIIAPDVPENSPLGRILSREGPDGEPTGIALEALNRAAIGGRIQGPQNPERLTTAIPNLQGLKPDKAPEYVLRAAIPVRDTTAGRLVSDAIFRMTPRQLATEAGAKKMLRIVNHPAAVPDMQARAYWSTRAKGGSFEQATRAAREADLVTVTKAQRGARGETLPTRG